MAKRDLFREFVVNHQSPGASSEPGDIMKYLKTGTPAQANANGGATGDDAPAVTPEEGLATTGEPRKPWDFEMPDDHPANKIILRGDEDYLDPDGVYEPLQHSTTGDAVGNTANFTHDDEFQLRAPNTEGLDLGDSSSSEVIVLEDSTDFGLPAQQLPERFVDVASSLKQHSHKLSGVGDFILKYREKIDALHAKRLASMMLTTDEATLNARQLTFPEVIGTLATKLDQLANRSENDAITEGQAKQTILVAHRALEYIREGANKELHFEVGRASGKHLDTLESILAELGVTPASQTQDEPAQQAPATRTWGQFLTGRAKPAQRDDRSGGESPHR